MSTARLATTDFEPMCELLYGETGIRLTAEKEGMMRARLRGRLAELGVGSLADYARLLRQDRGELQRFVNAMTTNKTDFFREPSHFEFLSRRLLPAFHSPGTFYAWSAASSTGQEAHTLAMVLDDHRRLHPGFEYRVLGSDIDTDVVDVATRGVYSSTDLDPVPQGMRATHFDKLRNKPSFEVREGGLESKKGPQGELYSAKEHLRARMKFRRFNLTADDGRFSRLCFDVIFLRNVLIYFDAASTRAVMDTIVRHLKPGGHLVIGHSESLRESCKELTFVGDAIYRKG